MNADESGRRVAAAEASDGRSHDAIHEAVVRELARSGATGALLDVGAGRATLLAKLANGGSFSRLVAADLVEYEAAPEGVEWIRCDLNEPLPISDATFNTLVAVEVIEHLENPWAAARDWFRVLRPGGVLVLTTPNNESFRSLLTLALRGHFAAFAAENFPAHLTALVRTDLLRILDQAGFQVDRLFYTDHGAVPKLTRLTWQRASAGRLGGLRFSDNVGCVARKPVAG